MMPANILQVLQVHELERRENIRVENIERSMLRDAADPFALRDEVFIATFRLTKDMVRYVADQVHPYLQRNNVRAIPSMTKLLSALSFFATGSYQRTVGQNFNFPMCQATISNIVNEVSLAIVVTMGEEWVQFPRTADEKNAIKQVFLENCNFPGTIGAIDCTHVALIAPRIEEHNYLNRKGYHSKNVQIICDYGLKILNVNAIYAGATHDSFIWRNSAIQQQMQISYNLGEINSWLVGDSGYPQQNWLMTPIVDAVPGTPAFAYSEGQMRARNCVERCIGVLKGRFRCIMGERKLRYEPEKVGNIVNTCAILHNICVAGRLNIEPAEPHGINNVIQGPQLRGNQARQELINRLLLPNRNITKMNGDVLEKDLQFYKDAANYWSEIPPTIDGMLGGFGHISETEIRSSKMLLKQLFNSKEPVGRSYSLDCGAGIGRVTKYLLSDLFDKVDMVEQNATFLQHAKSYLGPKILQEKIGNMFSEGLQSFTPDSKKYDVIWIQWVLGHLTDKDLVNFFKRCKTGLKKNGLIVVKENIASSDIVDLDKTDSSVTRPMMLLKSLFEQAELECCKLIKQINFPKGLYTVYMFVLKPKTVCHTNNQENNIKSDTCQILDDNIATIGDEMRHNFHKETENKQLPNNT